MKIREFTLMGLLLIGVIDVIEGDFTEVEIIDSNSKIIHTTLPTQIFPCEVKEGDMFYFEHVDGVTEIRCGEPDE
jgi:hypothetical protein